MTVEESLEMEMMGVVTVEELLHGLRMVIWHSTNDMSPLQSGGEQVIFREEDVLASTARLRP